MVSRTVGCDRPAGQPGELGLGVWGVRGVFHMEECLDQGMRVPGLGCGEEMAS